MPGLAFAALMLAGGFVPPPPPVVDARPQERPLVAWMPGAVRCGGQAVEPVLMRRPLTALGWTGMNMAPQSLTVEFRIDGEGRPLSIRPSVPATPFGDDIAPSLAATRFAAGAPQAGCTITYAQRITPLGAAPLEDLISYSLAPDSGPLPQAGWDRIKPAGATCGDEPRPQPLVQVLPDFRAMPATPGNRDWTMLGYDTDRRGRPRDVRVLYGTRNPALDREGVAAMKRSRFTDGPRTGCLYPYYRSPAILPAPPVTPAASPAGSTCPAEGGGWAQPPRLTYPEPFRRRSIEGWAIVAFDVAPWGEPGNVRILAAEPAAAFGEQAVAVIRSARKTPAGTGMTGCVERVVFKMGHPGIPAAALATDGG